MEITHNHAGRGVALDMTYAELNEISSALVHHFATIGIESKMLAQMHAVLDEAFAKENEE